MIILMVKLNQFHIGKTIDNHFHLNKKKCLLAYYSQSNEKMAVGKSEMASKIMDRIRPCRKGFKKRTGMDS